MVQISNVRRFFWTLVVGATFGCSYTDATAPVEPTGNVSAVPVELNQLFIWGVLLPSSGETYHGVAMFRNPTGTPYSMTYTALCFQSLFVYRHSPHTGLPVWTQSDFYSGGPGICRLAQETQVIPAGGSLEIDAPTVNAADALVKLGPMCCPYTYPLMVVIRMVEPQETTLVMAAIPVFSLDMDLRPASARSR